MKPLPPLSSLDTALTLLLLTVALSNATGIAAPPPEQLITEAQKEAKCEKGCCSGKKNETAPLSTIATSLPYQPETQTSESGDSDSSTADYKMVVVPEEAVAERLSLGAETHQVRSSQYTGRRYTSPPYMNIDTGKKWSIWDYCG